MKKFVINEEFLKQIETIQLILKNVNDGRLGGNHKSKKFGSSCEFVDYRDYIPGDDITKINWSAYSRFDRLYLKLYLDERQISNRIYIDASKSMDYGNSSKAEQAIKLAAAFAYLSICEMDRVSIYTIKGDKVEAVIENIHSKEAFYAKINSLNNIEFDGDSYISKSILSSKVGYGDGMSIIISDFLTDNDYLTAIDYLADKKRDVFCVQVLSKDELKPNVRGKVNFFDSEVDNKNYKKNINRDVINAYNMALDYVTSQVRNRCFSREASYLLINDAQSMNEIFLRHLVETGVLK